MVSRSSNLSLLSRCGRSIQEATIGRLAYGNFVTVVVNFLIIAFVLFLVVRMMNKFKRRTPVPVATPPKIEILLEDIRDLLAGKAKRS